MDEQTVETYSPRLAVMGAGWRDSARPRADPGVVGDWSAAERWRDGVRGGAHYDGAAYGVCPAGPQRETGRLVRWLREHDLLLLVFGTPGLWCVLELFGVFHAL